MNTSNVLLANVIARITNDSFHQTMCDYLKHIIDFDNCIFIVFSDSDKPQVNFKQVSDVDVFSKLDDTYFSGAYLLDPMYQYHLNRKKSGIFSLGDIAPDHFKRSKYYNWYYKKLGIVDELTIILTTKENMSLNISMGRDHSSERGFSLKEKRRLCEHKNIILALLELHWKITHKPLQHTARVQHEADRLIFSLKKSQNISITKRQAEVALFILKGHSSLSISLNLGISVETVKVFRKQLYNRCNISSQAQLFSLIIKIIEDTKGNNAQESIIIN